MFDFIINGIRKRPELIILLLMIMIITMFVIPLPTYIIDFLLAINIVLSILVFMSSFYINKILDFSTFPALLLITTLFRLALTISTSRLILINADAGEIITTFGEFVIGDSLVVGFVIFLIITIVQFIVITKGSERVAEVAARFSLDGMPGKQMSIDADLKAGIIDADEAGNKRITLERESKLYGSFDGAMKFIKGDAISSIIIIFVNMIGGLSVGLISHNMTFHEAISTYTILTIGDGLVTQIPALLISIGAGFVVTRVSDDGSNMGHNIIQQLLENPLVISITAMFTISIAFLPGFPFFIFFILFSMLSILFYFKTKKTSNYKKKDNKNIEKNKEKKISLNEIKNIPPETVIFIVLSPSSYIKKLEQDEFTERLRSQFFIDYGIILPEILLRSDNSSENHFSLLINEILVEKFQLYLDFFRIVNYSDEVSSLVSNVLYSQCGNNTYYWVDESSINDLKKIGYQSRSGVDELYHCISVLLTHNINEYFGIQETKHMLDKLECKYPDLIKEVLRHATVQRISEILQRLLIERISIRNMKLIMESLALWTPREKDVINLVEHVRGSLARYICHKFSYGNELNVIMISNEIEDVVRKGIRQTSGSTFLNLEPHDMDNLIDLLTLGLDELSISHKDIVLLTSIDVRRFIKKLVENKFPDLEVISYGEVTDSKSIVVIKTI